MNCIVKSTTWQAFTELSLPLNGNSIEELTLNVRNHEILDKGNLYQYQTCGTRILSAKNLEISNCPTILLVQIKRFHWLDYYNEPLKLNKHVDFGKNLKVQEKAICQKKGMDGKDAKWRTNEVSYSLKGIVQHRELPYLPVTSPQ